MKRENAKYTQRVSRGNQGMRGREECFNTYLDQSKDTNFCNTFSSVSTGID